MGYQDIQPEEFKKVKRLLSPDYIDMGELNKTFKSLRTGYKVSGLFHENSKIIAEIYIGRELSRPSWFVSSNAESHADRLSYLLKKLGIPNKWMGVTNRGERTLVFELK